MAKADLETFPFPEGSASRVLFDHFGRNSVLYATGVAAVIVTNLAEVAIPKLVQILVDGLGSGGRAGAGVVIAVLAVLLAQSLGRRCWRLTLGRETHRVASCLKLSLWQAASLMPMLRHQTDCTPGHLINLATSDVAAARMNFGWSLVALCDVVILGTLALGAMLLIDLELSLWCLSFMAAMPFVLLRLSRLEYQRHDSAQESLSGLNDLVAQTVSTVKLQRLTQTGGFWQSKLRAASEEYSLKRLAVIKTSIVFVLVLGLIPALSLAALLILSVDKLGSGQLTPGEFIALQSYLLILQGPLSDVGFVISDWQRSMASLQRIGAAARIEPDAIYATSTAHAPGRSDSPAAISADGLTFAYPGLPPILNRVSFELAQGDRLGITGPIGSGKSALVRILAGLERGFEGKLEILGREHRAWERRELSESVSMVPQRPFLFADTIRNNLLLDREASDEELWRVLEVVAVAEEIRDLPEALDSQLGEWGINLSGGQKQRIALARALLRKPRILLLDDCLSAVDTLSEEIILGNLDRCTEGMTLVWVAHRSSTLRYCGKILRLSR